VKQYCIGYMAYNMKLIYRRRTARRSVSLNLKSLLILGCMVINNDNRPTQPPTLCGTRNKYRPKCGDAMWLKVEAGWLIPFVDKRVGGRYRQLCDPFITHAMSALEMSFIIKSARPI